MPDCHSPPVSTFTKHLYPIIDAVDKVYDDVMAQHREAIKREDGRELVRIDPDKNYVVKHAAELNDIIKHGISVQVSTDLTYLVHYMSLRLILFSQMLFRARFCCDSGGAESYGDISASICLSQGEDYH